MKFSLDRKTRTIRIMPLALSLMIVACAAQTGKSDQPIPALTAPPIAPSQIPNTPPPTEAPTVTPISAASPASSPKLHLIATRCRAENVSSIAKCFDLDVPEHHDRLQGRTIRLHVAVYTSTASKRVDDPILFLMGGPGSPGIMSYAWSAESFQSFRGRRDVVVLDQRGTGSAIPKLTCPEYGVFLSEDGPKVHTDAESRDKETAAFRACHDRMIKEGVDLTAYTNAEIAADVEDLRRALGIERWNLFGWSYGTRVALTVMRDFPQSVRSAVLDSPYPPRANQLAEFPKHMQTAFHGLFARCAADEACDKAFPKLELAFYELLDQLDAHPVQAGATLITGKRFIDVMLTSYFDPYAIPQLPKLIYQARNGNTALLESKARQVFGYDNTFADGMQLSIDCADELPFITPSAVAANSAGLESHLAAYSTDDAQSYFDICSFWKGHEASPAENALVVSDTPTLVLVGGIDPFTPPDWAQLTASTLSHSQIAEFPSLSHGLFLADLVTGHCVGQLVDDFLDNPSRAVNMKCVEAFNAKPAVYTTD